MAVYLITGATGYIGSMVIKNLRKYDNRAEITALVRDRKKGLELLPSGTEVIETDLTDRGAVVQVETDCDYIIHCASITKSVEMVSHPVEVVESIVNTTQNVLELAGRRRVKAMVYVSSMEVYGSIDCSDGHRAAENEMGSVELMAARSCYPMGKRMAENICYCYYKEYGVPVKIARLAQTFGQGVPPADNRIFSQFANSVKNGTDIVLHTKGDSVGNYCGIDDTVSGILTVLYKGEAGEAYNVVNEENTMTIRQMAELVAENIAGGRIKVVYDIPKENLYGYAAPTGLRLSGRKLMDLEWSPAESLEEMYRDLIGSN